MNQVLESITRVISQAEHVRINSGALERFCSELKSHEPQFAHPFHPARLSPDEKIQFSLVYNAVNFCFWGDPKWAVEHQGKEIGGAYGMKAALHRALEEGCPLLDASFLSNITEADITNITRGNIGIPLLSERASFLSQIGLILEERYEGKAAKVVANGEGDALDLLKEVTYNFPCYDDSAEYKGNKVLFHKRAQLFVGDVGEVLQKQKNSLLRRNQLTAFADYKVPQILRKLGILEYSKPLSTRIDSYKQISAGSPEEVEIRAFTIEAVERMVIQLEKKFDGITACDVDWLLYVESKKLPKDNAPHHRTLTTAY